MRTRFRIYAVFIFFILFGSCKNTVNEGSVLPEKPNFLVFFIDDLRPELSCYGASHIKSPNIDRLASEGIQFNRAYCNVPVCGASRASLLTGTRPGPQRFVGYDTWADKDLPDHISLPGYFKKNGYYTISYGKIFHHQFDSQDSWSEKPWRADPENGHWRDYLDEMNAGDFQPSTERVEVADSAYIDGKIANAAIRKLQLLAKQEQPFMFWIGFVKPHLPFNAPAKYWDLYDRSQITLADNPEKPLNAPDNAMHTFGELRGYNDIPPEGPLSDDKNLELKHGYYACVSYMDALVGQVLEELKRLELEENTIVAIFGDHGWNLGEHGLWCKHCNFNTSLHVPLIIKVPGVSSGKKSEAIVEYVDLYPTFAELAGLEFPVHADGKSILPVIMDPDTAWLEPVFPRYILGNSIVTEDYLYTEYMRSRKDCTLVANMLYDHRTDPDENNNISVDPNNADLIDSLSSIMNAVHLNQIATHNTTK